MRTGHCDRVSWHSCQAERQRLARVGSRPLREAPSGHGGQPRPAAEGPGERRGSQRGPQTPETEGPSGAQQTTSAAVTQHSHPLLLPPSVFLGNTKLPPTVKPAERF